MRVHDHVVVLGMEGMITKILPDGKLEVVLSRILDSPNGPTNMAIVKPVTIYRICEYK